jgi:hypothetical protein
LIRKPISEVTAINPATAARAGGEAYRTQTAQKIVQARPGLAIKGVPGDTDQRRMLTPPFENMVMAQVGNGNLVTNVPAYATGTKQHRDYDPGRFGGLYSPAGEYAYKVLPITTTPSIDPVTGSYLRDPVTGNYLFTTLYPSPVRLFPPSEVVVVGKSVARPTTTNVIQESDVW